MNEVLHLIFVAIGSLALLFLLTKFIGNKQMSELNMFDYICGITIGSIAAEMATDLEEFWKPMTAMVIYAVVSVIFSYLNYKSIVMRRLLTGRPLMLLNRDKLYQGNLRKARLDLNEFLMMARNNGYFDISQLESAIMEPNGKISFLPKATYRPMNPEDMKLQPKKDCPVANVIIDGHIMKENLKFTGNNETWLKKQLHAHGVSDVKEVFLATCTCDNEISVYKKIPKIQNTDILQ